MTRTRTEPRFLKGGDGLRSLINFLRDVQRSRYFRHGLVLGAVLGAIFGWCVKPAPRPQKVIAAQPAVSLPVQVSPGFPRGEEVLFTVRVVNETNRVLGNLEVTCAFVDTTGTILGSGAQSWAAVGVGQTLVGVVRAPALLGTTKAECQGRGE